MKAMNNCAMCAYLRRKENVLGDDITRDFLAPIYFRAKKETITKRTASLSGMVASSSSTYFVTFNLPLKQSEMKKDDVIIMTGSYVSGLLQYQNQRVWRVENVEIIPDSLRIIPKDEEEAERRALKRIEVA